MSKKNVKYSFKTKFHALQVFLELFFRIFVTHDSYKTSIIILLLNISWGRPKLKKKRKISRYIFCWQTLIKSEKYSCQFCHLNSFKNVIKPKRGSVKMKLDISTVSVVILALTLVLYSDYNREKTCPVTLKARAILLERNSQVNL